MSGYLEVLNIGRGDMKFTFDKDDVQETERAKRCVEDMLRRGYSIFVEHDDGKMSKVKSFDAENEEYIIADGPLYSGDSAPEVAGEVAPKKRGRPKKVPLKDSKATAVPRTGGG